MRSSPGADNGEKKKERASGQNAALCMSAWAEIIYVAAGLRSFLSAAYGRRKFNFPAGYVSLFININSSRGEAGFRKFLLRSRRGASFFSTEDFVHGDTLGAHSSDFFVHEAVASLDGALDSLYT